MTTGAICRHQGVARVLSGNVYQITRGEPSPQKTGVGQLFDLGRGANELPEGSLEDERSLRDPGQLT